MQYLRARYYNPASGTFNRLDPFFGNLQDPQSLHKYLYVHGDPVQGIDPSGEKMLGALLGVLGIVGTLYTIVTFDRVWNAGELWHGHVLVSILVRREVNTYFADLKADSPELYEAAGLVRIEKKLDRFLSDTRINAQLARDDLGGASAKYDPWHNVILLPADFFNNVTYRERRKLVHELVHAYLDNKYVFGPPERYDEGVANCIEYYHLAHYENTLLNAWRLKQRGHGWVSSYDRWFDDRRRPDTFNVNIPSTRTFEDMTQADVWNTNIEFGLQSPDSVRIYDIFYGT
jgi:hypothetical protein